MFRWGLGIVVLLVLAACSANRGVVSSGKADIAKQLRQSDRLEDHHTGLAVYDPSKGDWLFQQNSDQYFTPASNTKILTMYAALELMGDTLPALVYEQKGDTLLFRGAGNPFLFWGPDQETTTRVSSFLGSHNGVLAYDPGPEIERFGAGWSWDDYNYAYQVERSMLPVFGNRVEFQVWDDHIVVVPEYFGQFVYEEPRPGRSVVRDPFANAFYIDPDVINRWNTNTRNVPFIVSDYDIAQILTQELGQEVTFSYSNSVSDEAVTLPGPALDTVLKYMMQPSDNFIAEQLLLSVGLHACNSPAADSIIAFASDSLFDGAPDDFLWADGSGLSRYNMFTPRSLVWLLDNMYRKHGIDYLQEIFPAGGVSGTIENWYPGPEGKPFVYAKTGTLRGVHCLSGYLITRKNTLLIFSLMNNNYKGSSSGIKPDMQRVLEHIYNKY